MEKYARIILDAIKNGKIKTKNDLQKYKKSVCHKYRIPKLFSNAEILSYATEEEREDLLFLLMKRPTRTISGIAVVAVMTRPIPCPHGKCLYCPGGPEFGSPQSYTGLEPAALRSIQNNFNAFKQVSARLRQLKAIGHPIDKIDLIIMGGTFPSFSNSYQEEFVKGCLDALIQNESKNIKEALQIAETSIHRLVGMTVETRPDYCSQEIIDRMLEYGTTRVEIGVQILDDQIYKKVKRGHTVKDVTNAFRLLKDSSLKVTAHMMPFLPGSSIEKDIKSFKTLFFDERFKPDEIKIYPTQVIEGTELYNIWKKGEYEASTDEKLIDLLIEIKKLVPPYVRIKRIIRDIPAYKILAGTKKSNLREIVQKKLQDQGFKCNCIRCREVGHVKIKSGIEPIIENIGLKIIKYDASSGKEFFLSFEDLKQKIIIGFLRLRIPSQLAHRSEISEVSTALVRELHVYGPMLKIGEKSKTAWQHQGYGKKLLEAAEQISKNQFDCRKILVISGVGAREYYYKLGFKKDGPYVSKIID
ncbi:MAG: tRNA uridine(34) 5-carboxymethylaminomethyl modification radical SAM/GNAT enzyme Elp3 [Candidatus Helarchaeota archaeon]